MKGWRWLMAVVIGGVIYLGLQYSNDTVRQAIIRVVYGTDDLTYVRQLFSTQQPEMILTSSQQFAPFTGVKRYGDGFIVRYEELLTITARNTGVIVFTGHTARMGKVISVAYDDGLTVTFGWMDDFYHLPYSAVKKDEVIGVKNPGEIYIEIEQRGHAFTLEETVEWLRYD